MENKKIAAALLTYNHPNLSFSSLSSLAPAFIAQKIPFYVLHNGSTEQARLQLENFSKDIKIHFFSRLKNEGFAAGVNTLFEKLFHASSSYEWIFFHTNDIFYHLLPTQLDGLLKTLSPGFYAPWVWKRRVGQVDSCGGLFSPLLKKLRHCRSPKDFKKSFLWFRYVPGQAFLIHRSIWEAVGPFDESLHTYWEDVDFSMRCQKHKKILNIFPQWQLIHKVGKTCHKDPFYTNYLFNRNKKIVSRRYLF